MKCYDKIVMESEHNESEITAKAIEVASSIKMPQEKIETLLKRDLMNSKLDNIKMETYYLFKFYRLEAWDDPAQMNTIYKLRCEFKIADSNRVKVYYYDDRVMNEFRKPNGFWKRFKLAFRYLFRKKI